MYFAHGVNGLNGVIILRITPLTLFTLSFALQIYTKFIINILFARNIYIIARKKSINH